MTTVVRTPAGKIMVLTKGADTICLPLIKFNHDERLKEQTVDYLDFYARLGLRTLLFLQREITSDEFNEWHAEHKVASTMQGKARE